jgi:hypothetical protein
MTEQEQITNLQQALNKVEEQNKNLRQLINEGGGCCKCEVDKYGCTIDICEVHLELEQAQSRKNSKYEFGYVRLGYSFDNITGEGFVLKWSCKGVGFGELTFIKDGDKTKCETECMSPGFVQAVLDEFYRNLTLIDV